MKQILFQESQEEKKQRDVYRRRKRRVYIYFYCHIHSGCSYRSDECVDEDKIM